MAGDPLAALTGPQQFVVDEVHKAFHRDGRYRWPSYNYVETRLHQVYPGCDVVSILGALVSVGEHPLGGGRYGPLRFERSGGFVDRSAPVALTVLGFHHAGWVDGVHLALGIIRQLADTFMHWTPDPDDPGTPSVEWSTLINFVPSWAVNHGPFVRSILENEPPTWGEGRVTSTGPCS